jgi:AcrR family transcriptional regulator
VPRRAETRARLLQTAGTLFYDEGITATGVDAVAHASGFSKPTLYAHFGSKRDLVAAVLEQRHSQRREELCAWVDAVADLRARPLAVFVWLAGWYGRAGARGCGFLNAAAELAHRDDPGRTVVQQEKRWLTDFLTALNREAGLQEPERLASQLVLLIDGIAGRVVVWGPDEAQRAVADATRAAETLIAAAE